MRALAAQLPEKAGELLGDAGLSAQNAAAWDLQSVFAWLLENLEQAYSAPLRFAGESLVLLLLGCAAALVLGSGSWKACLEAFCALAFGAASLSAMRQLTLSAEQTAASCQTYLLSFIPVFSSAAAAGGQTSGALAYSTMFLAMSNFLAWAIRTVILPLIQIYFCLSVSAAVWNNAGIEEAALLFARTLSFLLKSCGGVFTFVLGLQSILTHTADSAALRLGRSALSGVIPVVGDAAAAALTGAVGAVQLLKGSLALAALAALGGLFLPVFAQCLLFYLAFSVTGIVALGTGQAQCGRICRTFAGGARLCGSVLVLYFFMVLLSTALLLITGTGG